MINPLGLIYKTGTWALTPAAGLFLARRKNHKKEDPVRINERKGIPSLMRPKGPLIWIHGASVGEVNAALPLIYAMEHKNFNVLLTSGTVTSAQVAARRLPRNAAHQYVPLDVPLYVNRFLNHWQPNLSIFIESELWPNLLEETDKRGIPVILANARMSQKSFRNWSRFPSTARRILDRFQLCLAQSQQDAEYLSALGAPHVKVTGNLKFDASPPAANRNEVLQWMETTKNSTVFVAASTHEGEEAHILRAVKAIKEKDVPDLITILIPRHPTRRQDVRKEVEKAGLTAALRTQSPGLGSGTDVYIADTIGEVGLFYRLAQVVFLGGSLIPHGGQNPIEPAKLGKPVVHGRYTSNFKDVYAVLDGRGAKVVTHPKGLEQALLPYLTNTAFASDEGMQIANAVSELTGALSTTLQALEPFFASSLLDKRAEQTEER